MSSSSSLHREPVSVLPESFDGNESLSSRDSSVNRTACSECQRRKQKCNRQWPCNHCQKRKVADKCLFKDAAKSQIGSVLEFRRKREFAASEDSSSVDLDPNYDYGSDEDDEVDSLHALGYMATHLFSGLTTHAVKSKRVLPREYSKDAKSCPQLERALQVLPPRPYTDVLVENFVKNVNFHYYIIYPPSFLEQYQAWWSARADHRPLGIQWTCLLFMVCACSTQYTDLELQRKLELDLGQPIQRLTETYHDAARELHSIVPVGHHHIFSVQKLLHSCYWFKSEARFVECWHVLNRAIREAQELGIHQESSCGDIPNFERELRRRVWCVLDTWDWQISALLSRPMIIDRSDCDVGLPSLTIEGYQPNPLLHMKLQSELIAKLAARFGLPKNVIEPPDVKEYQAMLETWGKTFPPQYSFDSPDRNMDAARPWLVLHRHYLHTMYFSMLLDPIRAYLSRKTSRASPEAVQQIRTDGISYALRLMGALYGFFDHVYPRDAKFHFVIFCIFDTGAVLASVILHDEDSSAPYRDQMLDAIESAYEMVMRLATAIPAAVLYQDILTRLRRKVMRHLEMLQPSESSRRRKRARIVNKPLSPQAVSQLSEASVSSGAASTDRSASPHPLSREVPAEEQAPGIDDVLQTSHSESSAPPGLSAYSGVPGQDVPSQPSSISPHSAANLDAQSGLAPPPPPPPHHTQPHIQQPNEAHQMPSMMYSMPNQEPMVPMAVSAPENTFRFVQYDPSFLPVEYAVLDPMMAQTGFIEEQFPVPFADLTNASGQALPDLGPMSMSTAELGSFGELWRWQSLDLGIITENQSPILQPEHQPTGPEN